MRNWSDSKENQRFQRASVVEIDENQRSDFQVVGGF